MSTRTPVARRKDPLRLPWSPFTPLMASGTTNNFPGWGGAPAACTNGAADHEGAF